MLQGVFRSRRWQVRQTFGLLDFRCKKLVLRFSGACVSCGMVFDFFTSSLQQNQRTKMMWFVRIGLWRLSAFAHVWIWRLCDTFNGSARQHLYHGAMTGCENVAASLISSMARVVSCGVI